jgi:hypothetical protein
VPSVNGNGARGGNGRVATAPAAAPRDGAGSPSTNGAGAAPAPHVDRITERQLDAVLKLAVAKALKPKDIDAISLRAFNRKPAELTLTEASSLIKELSNLKRQVA